MQASPEQAVASKNTFFDLDLSNLISQNLADRLLMVSMSLTFFWFGILKVFGMSPVVGLLQHSFSLFAAQPYLGLLGFFEVVIAVGLLIPQGSKNNDHPDDLASVGHYQRRLYLAKYSLRPVFSDIDDGGRVHTQKFCFDLGLLDSSLSFGQNLSAFLKHGFTSQNNSLLAICYSLLNSYAAPPH